MTSSHREVEVKRCGAEIAETETKEMAAEAETEADSEGVSGEDC